MEDNNENKNDLLTGGNGKVNTVSNFIRGSSILVLSNICLRAINFFLLPLYTKNLTPAMIGVSDSITTLTSIIRPLLTMGLDSAYSAFYFDVKDPDRNKKVYVTLSYSFFVIGLIPILLSVFSEYMSRLIFKNDGYKTIIIIALLGISFNLWYLPFSLELRLKNMMGRFGIVTVVSSLSMVLLNILFVSIFKLKEMALILSTSIVSVEQLLLYVCVLRQIPERKYFDRDLLGKMTRFSIPLIPTVLMAWILSLSDRYILLFYHGDSDVGLYGIGSRFVTLLNVIINAITTAYTTFAFGSKDDRNSKEKYYYIFNVVSIVLLFISFTVAIFSKEIIRLMTNILYLSSYIIIRDMLYGQVLYAMSTIVSYGIVFKKKSVYSLLSISCGALINLILNFIFIPKFGIRAAAITTLLGYFVSLIVCYYFSEKLFPCEYGMVRMLLVTVGTYLISMLSLECSIAIKFLIWGGVIAICSYIFRDIIKIICNYILKIT